MGKQASPRRKIIAEYLEKYPEAKKQTLAKLMVREMPLEFTSVEAARSAIRDYTGASGDRNRRNIKPIKDCKGEPCTLKIPKGETQAKRTKIIREGKWLVMGDMHVPYHDAQAIELAVKHGVDSECDSLYINGDAIDFYKSSQWVKDPNKRSLQSELDCLHEILDQITPYFDRLVYKIGNHEDRFTRRLWQCMPEAACLGRFNVDEILEVKERGFEVVESKQKARFGKLWAFHGHELPQGLTAAVNPARGICLRVREPAFTNHYHQTSAHVESGGVSNKQLKFFSIGCLCNLTPDYAPINKWNHGFATIDVKGSKYQFENYTVEEGEVFSG